MKPVVLAVHGGAGTIDRGEMSDELRAQIHQGLREALLAGYQQLMRQKHASSSAAALEATITSVSSLEDNPLFNAGRGSVFNANGHIEMEAAVMDGRQRQIGACTLIKHVRNPVQLARLVMNSNDAAFLAYPQAEDLARRSHLPMMPEEYFYTQTRWQQYLRHRQQRMTTDGDDKVESGILNLNRDNCSGEQIPSVMGTVGAVALDAEGNLAASTSTGGRTGKPAQRIGDTPLIGSGTFADNKSCAVSCTGHGEYFMRQMAAADIHARVFYGKQSLLKACNECLGELKERGGSGGVIAIDRNGAVAMPLNSSGMYRGYISSADGGIPHTFIFDDEYQGDAVEGFISNTTKNGRRIIGVALIAGVLSVATLFLIKFS